jgi:hypothetical protein
MHNEYERLKIFDSFKITQIYKLDLNSKMESLKDEIQESSEGF